MSLHTLWGMMLIPLPCLGFMSCSDEGAPFMPFAITSISPPPGAVAVNKAQSVLLAFSKPVPFSEVQKVRMQYTGTGEEIHYGIGWAGGPPIVVSDQWPLTATPWKPGRTVEVSIPAELADEEGNILGEAKYFSFSVAIDSLPFAVAATRPAQNDSVAPGNVSGALTFTDYFVEFPDSLVTISPPATIHILHLVIVARRTITSSTGAFLQKECGFILIGAQPGTRYDLTVKRSVHDYEGETLAGDYHLVFFTTQ